MIESTRFSREFSKLNDRIESVMEHVNKLNLKKGDIKNLEARVYEMSAEMMAVPGWEQNQEQQTIIQNTAKYVNQLKLELKQKYLSSEKFRNVYPTIIDCIILARRIQDRKKHWMRLGITEFKTINSAVRSGAELTQIQMMAHGVNTMQKGILLSAQRLFILASAHLPDAPKIRNELENAVVTLKAQNILP